MVSIQRFRNGRVIQLQSVGGDSPDSRSFYTPLSILRSLSLEVWEAWDERGRDERVWLERRGANRMKCSWQQFYRWLIQMMTRKTRFSNTSYLADIDILFCAVSLWPSWWRHHPLILSCKVSALIIIVKLETHHHYPFIANPPVVLAAVWRLPICFRNSSQILFRRISF